MPGTGSSSTTLSICRSAKASGSGEGRPGFMGTLISGWTLNGVTTLQAGFPLGFTATPNLIGSGYGLRPNVDPNCDKKIDGSAVDRLNKWFNTSCFSVPNAGFVAADPSTDPRLRWQLGNAPRTDPDLRGQGVNNWNLAIAKRTSDWATESISHCAPRRSTCSTACSSARRIRRRPPPRTARSARSPPR